jgi:hypothetical protein
MIFRKKGTRIVVIALSAKGRKALAIQKRDEIELRESYKGVSKRKIPFDVRSYLKTVSLFIPKEGDPERHEILGFSRMNMVAKSTFYAGVRQSMRENGCDVDDFEVKFYDE